MFNKKGTKHALLMSVISLLLCCSMLIGTTFAWFTDEVKSGTNIIAAGNLDVELTHTNAKVTDDGVEGDTELFVDENGNPILWEPGVVTYETFTVKNVGNLALKYNLAINFTNENFVVEADGTVTDNSLSDVLKVGVINGALGEGTTREGLIQYVDDYSAFEPMKSFVLYGDMEPNEADEVYTIVIYWEPSENDNNWNVNNGRDVSDDYKVGEEPALRIDLGIHLTATQKVSEDDSFGPDYDAGAYLPVVYTEAELKSALENNESVQLGNDIVLTGTWTPIGDKDAGVYYTGTLEGNGHTISGLSVTEGDYVSLISAAKNATIKNLTVEGSVTGDNAAGIVARVEGNTVIENCVSYVTVNGTTKAGGIVSNVTGANAQIINCTNNGAVSCSKEAVGGVGGIIGYVNTNATVEVIACVNNGAVTGTDGQTTGAVIGYAATDSSGKILGFTNTGVITGSNYVGDGLSRWIENENGLVLAGYCGSPANWTYTAAVSSAEELATALTSDEKDIYVVLESDIDLPISSLGQQTGGSGEYKLGGENTENITIYLNGNKLNITTTYWSAIGAKNDKATITVKDGSMTSTGNSAGTWNAWDLRFSNCNWYFEDVDFLKAVALDNAGKVTNMKNVTITDSHNKDTYALWITAEGQTVNIDGLTIDMLAATDGRGIKIDEQYVDAAAKVTLNVSNATIKTEEKAAILVKSVAGADITLSNVNISNVANDSVNAVWVDEASEAYYDLVTVAGGKKALESRVISSAADLAALSNTKISGTYELVADIDMGGAEFSAMSTWYTSANFNGNGYTISNVKVVSGENDNGTEQASMFFVSTNGSLTVSDLTLKDITVTTKNVDNGYAAAVIGYCEGVAVLNNVDVKNAAITGSKSSGMLVGHLTGAGSLTATGCDVAGSITISDFETDGHYAGEYVGTIAGKTALNNCTANITLDGNLKSTNAGIIYGRKLDVELTINGSVHKSASNQDELNKALTGDVNVTLGEGTYDLPGVSNGDVTISGTEDTVIKVTTPAFHGSDVTFNGVTIQGSGYNTGVQHVNTVTYNDVTVNGTMLLYGEKVVFNNCTFNLSGDYIWTYGAKEVEFNNCTFNTTGKAILIYKDGGVISTKVTVKGCTFNATAPAYAGAISNQACAAIEIQNYMSSINLITEDNTYDANFSGEWRIKQYDTANNCTITVNSLEYTKTALDGKLMTVTSNVAEFD